MKKLSKLFLTLIFSISGFSFAEEKKDDKSIEEVIVTATSRETSVLEVPYNISTISGADIEDRAILDNGELLRSFVGISTIDRGYRNAGTTSNIRIRGLNVDSSALQDYPTSAVSSVSTYVDQTPVFANFLLRDLKRVEVLRGPQGTLYGSGSLGGTIRYITNDPEIDTFEGTFSLTGSSVNGSDSTGNAIDLVLNIPISQKAAYRVAVSELDYPGITDYVNVFEVTDVAGNFYADESYGIPMTLSAYEGNNPTTAYGYPTFYTSPPAISPVNDADDVKISFIRHKLLFDISDKVELIISSASQDDDIGGRRQASTGTKYVLSPSCNSLLNPSCYTESTYGEYENGAVMLEPSSRDVSVHSAELTFDGDMFDIIVSKSQHEKNGSSITDNTGYFAGLGTFTSSLAAYYSDPFLVGGYFGKPTRPYAPAHRQYSNDADTLEIKIISEVGKRFDYIFGYFQQDENQTRNQQTYIKGVNLWRSFYNLGDFVVDSNEQDFDYYVGESIKNEAYFGEITFHLNDKIDTTFGFRKFDVEAQANMNMSFKLYNVGPATDVSNNVDDGTLTKFNLSYKADDSKNYFFTISDGFRRGGVNAVPTEGTFIEEAGWVPFSSDTVKNIEAGVKGTTQSGTYYNLSIYNISWEDPQLNTSTPIYGYYAVINGNKARTNGLDIELSGSINSIDWNIGYAYNNTELTKDLFTPASSPILYASEGADLPGSPKNSLNVNFAHTSYLDSGLGLVNRLDMYYQSETRNYIGENSLYDANFGGFDIINASSTIFNDKGYITFFVKNILNERGVTGAFLNPAFGPQPDQGFYGSNNREFFALPRTLGIAISRSF